MNKMDFKNLKTREKILAFCALALLAIFLAFKFYENFLQAFLIEESTTEEYDFYNKEENFKSLKEKLQTLEKQMINEEQKEQNYTKELKAFTYDDTSYIKNLQELARKSNINIKNITNLHIQEKNFDKYQITLDSYGEFHSLLDFIQKLEKSEFIYKINSIEFENLNQLDLKLKLECYFLVIKY